MALRGFHELNVELYPISLMFVIYGSQSVRVAFITSKAYVSRLTDKTKGARHVNGVEK